MNIPETGFLRLKQIIGDPNKQIPALIPVGATTWWNGVKSGRYPKGVMHGGRRLWAVEEIRALIAEIGGQTA